MKFIHCITITPSVGNEARILASDVDTATPHPLKIAGDYVRITTSGNTAATEVARFTAEGDVGIGTSTPDSKLHVYDANPNIFLEESDATSTFNITDIQLAGGALNINTRQSNGTFVSTDYQMSKGADGFGLYIG